MKKYLCWIIFLTCIYSPCCLPAQDNGKDSLVSCFLHIAKDSITKKPYHKPVSYFKLHYKDSTYDWVSEKVDPIDEDSLQFLIKAEIPIKIYEQRNMISCAAYLQAESKGNEERFYATEYGGIKFSDITLQLNSNPAGADIYLFPNRYWTEHLENTNWQKNIDDYWKFKVGTSTTNTIVKIDQTVYVIVFKLGDQFKQTILFTKPETVQNKETISVNF